MIERRHPVISRHGKWITIETYTVDANGVARGPTGRVLTVSMGSRGYVRINVWHPSFGHRTVWSRQHGHHIRTQDSRPFELHRVMCATFHGIPEPGRGVARHIDGDKRNNAAVNLRWGSYRDNALDAVRHRAGSNALASYDDDDGQQDLFQTAGKRAKP